MNWIRNGENAGPFAHSSVIRSTFAGVDEDESSAESDTSDLDDLYIDSFRKDAENDIAWRLSEQRFNGVLETMTAIERKKRALDLGEVANNNLNNNSLTSRQLGKPISNPRILHASGVDKSPRLSSRPETEEDIVETKQRATVPGADTASSLLKSEVTIKDKPVLTAKEQGSDKLRSSGNRKRKPRKSRNQRRNATSTIETKVYPKLELPDPTPSPGANNGGSGWSDVVGRGNIKAAKKLQDNTSKRLNERDFVNASSYLIRDTESELPIRERAAIDVRFGMGSAKHDVRRVVPRSALE